MHASVTPGADAHGEPTLHELHVFAAVAQELHFGRAARRLGITQPSLSQSLRRLEGRLDLVLFERTSRRVALTPVGTLLLPWAKGILEDLAAMRIIAALEAAHRPGAGARTSPTPWREPAARAHRSPVDRLRDVTGTRPAAH
jgi:DNA-binding transcriptional LysR family regulator